MDKPNQLELPKELIESLKQEKEDNKRRENIEKLSLALADKQNSLSIDQTNQLRALKQSLESDTLQSLEDKSEANSIADETLGLLTDIKSNTEDLKFEFSDGQKGIIEKILVFGRLLITSFVGGFIAGVMEIFDFPTLKKLFKKFVIRPLKATIFRPFILLFETIRSVFSAIGDVYKKAGTGKFLKGNTYRILGARGIKFFETIFKRVKGVVEFLKMIGGKIKVFFITLKGMGSTLLTRLITPFTNIKKAFLDIVTKLKELGGGKGKPGPLSRIMGYVRNLGGLMTRFGGLFRVLGFAVGKLLWPVMMAVDAIRGMIHSFKTTEFTNPIMKGIDMIYTGIGFAVGGFVGGIADLIKDLASWIATKLGFEGFSEFLDSFSIREMIEEGFGMMAEFFSALFTDIVPALIHGVKAAANPFDGKSFGEAYEERLVYGPGGKPKEEKPFTGEAFNADDVTQEQMDRYEKETSGMSAGEVAAYIKTQRKIDFDLDNEAKIAAQQRKLDQLRNTQVSFSPIGSYGMTMMPNSTGAQMEATQNETLEVKDSPPIVVPVINTTDASTTNSNIVSTSTNQNSHVDRTMGLGSGQFQPQ